MLCPLVFVTSSTKSAALWLYLFGALLFTNPEDTGKEREKGMGSDVSYLKCQSSALLFVISIHLALSLPSSVKLSTLSSAESTIHSNHCSFLGLLFLPHPLISILEHMGWFRLVSTSGKRRPTGWNKDLNPHGQGEDWCSWWIPSSTKCSSLLSN